MTLQFRNVSTAYLYPLALISHHLSGAAYSTGKLFGSEKGVRYEVLSATRQVVAGLKYDLTVKTYFESEPITCEVNQVGVWDHFGYLSVTDSSNLQGRAPCSD